MNMNASGVAFVTEAGGGAAAERLAARGGTVADARAASALATAKRAPFAAPCRRERAHGRGADVNATARGPALASHHSAAKGAVLSCAKALAREEFPRGVAAAPGSVDAFLPRKNFRESEKTISECAKTRLALPSEVAAGFLPSPDASYLTGRVMAVDGGEAMN